MGKPNCPEFPDSSNTILDDVAESIFQGIERGDDTRTISYYALKAVEKAGWQIVPIQATRAMWIARADVQRHYQDWCGCDPSEMESEEHAIWRAMLSAAPKLSLESEKL